MYNLISNIFRKQILHICIIQEIQHFLTRCILCQPGPYLLARPHRANYVPSLYINRLLCNLQLLQENGRIVQSLGTPYRGSPLAGILAFLAELLFDYSCGLNEDLTYSGADRWESKIPLEYKASVYYYTTQVSSYVI